MLTLILVFPLPFQWFQWSMDVISMVSFQLAVCVVEILQPMPFFTNKCPECVPMASKIIALCSWFSHVYFVVKGGRGPGRKRMITGAIGRQSANFPYSRTPIRWLIRAGQVLGAERAGQRGV